MAKSIFQQLRDFNQATGERFQHRVFDEVQAVTTSDTACFLFIRTHKVRETSRGYEILKAGTRLISYQRTNPTEPWVRSESLLWDEEHEQFFHRTLGNKTAPEQIESARWADLCYRPGTAKSPMDGPYAVEFTTITSESDGEA